MKTKTIIDSEASLEHLKNTKGKKMNQKELAEEADISEQKLITWKTKKAPAVVADVIKIQQITGAPLDVIIKEVPE